MTNDPSHFEAALAAAWPVAEWRDMHILLAVSGGADSVALLRATIAVKAQAGGAGRLFVAHMNHGLRAADATADDSWLADVCQRLGVPLEIGRAEVLAIANSMGDGLEAAARTARYDFLRAAAERLGARFVAVAHTADDQVETVLHRLTRGTGIAGLAGMQRVRPLSPTVTIVRPLLAIRRQQVLEYLASIGQDFRSDATNADARFTRNRVRHELLPLLRSQFNQEVDGAILRLAQQADEAQQLLANLAAELIKSHVSISPTAVIVDCRPLADVPPLLVREVCKIAWSAAGWPLQNMGLSEWQRLAATVASSAATSAFNLPSGLRAECDGKQLHLSKKA